MRVLRAILIAILLFPQVLRAQISFDPGEGCLNVVDFTAGSGLRTQGDRLIGVNYLHERFVNEQLSVGAGAGYSHHQQYKFSSIPVYFSTHYFFSDSRFSSFVNLKAGIYWMLEPKNLDTNQEFSISGNQPGFSLYVSPGAGIKVLLSPHIGLMASVSYDGYFVNAYDNAKNYYHSKIVPIWGLASVFAFRFLGGRVATLLSACSLCREH